MQLYTAAYNYCISSGMGGTSGIAAGAHLVGGELYTRVATYFERHLQGILQRMSSLSHEDLLQLYSQEWDRYTSGANFVHRMLIYLNRHWVKHEREEGRTDIHTVYTLALDQWKKHVFMPLQREEKVIEAVLHQIELQRNGKVIQSSLLKSVLDSCVSLGIDETDATRLNLDVYQSEFQQPFLQSTEAYYQAESQSFLASNSVTDYMKKAQTRLEEEENRVELYMHASSYDALMDVCRTELITNHAQTMWDRFGYLLENEMKDDLARMYALLSQIPGGLDPLREQFEAYVKRTGLETVSRDMEESSDVVDPSKYVHSLLRVYNHNMATVTSSFQSEAGFLAALDKACRSFMNINQVTGTSASRSPELLAKFIDGLLKKNTRGEDEQSVEESLDKAMIVFKYIEDRDYFQKFYAKFLSRRLVSFSSASIDAEESMISRLKEICGFEYTSKLQRMFTEAGLSKELNDRFQESGMQSNKDLNFYSFVLTSGVWPLQPPSSEFTMPDELQSTHDEFVKFYNTQHTHRQLTWLWHLSTNEIHTTYLPRKYIFSTSTYQTAILLLFNTHSVLTFDEIAEATRLEKSVLNAALLPMVKLKVLHLLDDSYSLNKDFKGKKVRMNLNIPVRAEQKSESAEVAKTVHEDRKVLLQATIVRIMKARKTLKHNLLLTEVISQLQARFQPKVPDIKKVGVT
ncbi:ubiquitin ligase (cullin) of SCF [Malassezia pachydermatis]